MDINKNYDEYDIIGTRLMSVIEKSLKSHNEISLLEILWFFSVIESFFTFMIYSSSNIEKWENESMKRDFHNRLEKSSFWNYDNLYEIVFWFKLSDYTKYWKIKHHFKIRNKITHWEFNHNSIRNWNTEISREKIPIELLNSESMRKFLITLIVDFHQLIEEIAIKTEPQLSGVSRHTLIRHKIILWKLINY